MRWVDLKLLTVLPVLLVGLVFLASCGVTPPPTQELADAEAAYADAEAAGCPECAPEECAAALHSLNKGRALATDFCSELEARRLLMDAKAKALEAQNKCSIAPPLAPVPGIKDIFFDFDRDNVRADAEAILQENAEVLKNDPSLTIVIEGYADLRGSVQYNLGLAQRRADNTKSYLEGLGIDGSRIEAVGVGETEIFGEGSSSDAYQLNRRSHFKTGNSPGALIYFKKANEEPAS